MATIQLKASHALERASLTPARASSNLAGLPSEVQEQAHMLISFAEQVSAVPNVSYLSLPARTFIEQKLADADFTPKEKANIKTERQYCHDEYGIYARIKRGNPPRRMLVVMHLDHPGIVLDGTGSGKAVGSLGTERLQAIIDQEGPIPVRTYTYDGKPLEPNTITRVTATGKVTVATVRPSDRNAHAIWDMQ